jgi:hypothetical protein
MIAMTLILLFATTAPTTQPSTTAPTAYVVITVKGTAQFRPAGETHWRRLEQGAELHDGDFVRTAPKSEVRIRRPDGSEMILDRLAIIEIGKPTTRPTTGQVLPGIDQA